MGCRVGEYWGYVQVFAWSIQKQEERNKKDLNVNFTQKLHS